MTVWKAGQLFMNPATLLTYTGGGQKKVAPHQKWLTWFIMAINKRNINKSYVLVLVWLAVCKCKQ